MFINLSNHPSSLWAEEQLKEAEKFGKIKDVPFPFVSPYATENDIEKIAETIVCDIMKEKPDAVMCQGEFSLSYAIISRLLQKEVTVLTACSEREAEEQILDNGGVKKICLYKFIKFRKYN